MESDANFSTEFQSLRMLIDQCVANAFEHEFSMRCISPIQNSFGSFRSSHESSQINSQSPGNYGPIQRETVWDSEQHKFVYVFNRSNIDDVGSRLINNDFHMCEPSLVHPIHDSNFSFEPNFYDSHEYESHSRVRSNIDCELSGNFDPKLIQPNWYNQQQFLSHEQHTQTSCEINVCNCGVDSKHFDPMDRNLNIPIEFLRVENSNFEDNVNSFGNKIDHNDKNVRDSDSSDHIHFDHPVSRIYRNPEIRTPNL